MADACLTLIHYMVHVGLPGHIAAHRDLVDPGLKMVTCVCSCTEHTSEVQYPVLSEPLEWVRRMDRTIPFWPLSDSEASWNRFKDGLGWLSKALLGEHSEDLGAAVPYSLTTRFRHDLLEAKVEERAPIAKALARRLYMSRWHASKDVGLKDEAVKGRVGERRFRVTESARIHYEEESSSIVLTRYYPPGKHDEGLR